MRLVSKLASIAVLLLGLMPAVALADDEKQDDGAEETGPINPYEQIEGDPALWNHGWIALSIGGALLVAGGVTGGLALSLNSELEDKCQDGQCPPPQHDDLSRRDGLATASTALLATGFATAMVGLLVLTVFAPEREEEPDSEVALLPLVTPQLTGAALEWRF